MKLDTSSGQVPMCLKQLSLCKRFELEGRLSNKIRLIAWPFRYHNRFKYSLLVDVVEISFSLVVRAVAFRVEGTGFDPS